ncbi:MAG: alkene reductase [Planctomycetota bacterium]|nr:alkene reductase [Planctomycetota bacterium]
MANEALFDKLEIGDLDVPHRVLMAPLTRSRASQPGDVPTAMNATYYAQRATAGLIVSEATSVSPLGKAYAFIPGMHTDEQEAGWKLVVDAVHEAGGLLLLQLFHGGRVGHHDLLPAGEVPVAPSALRAATQTYVSADSGMIDVDEPRALETSEIAGVVEEFRAAAERAKRAGFDGIELHGANGYLLDQFTRDGSNKRTDEYGGSLENRLRFPLEVARAVAEVFGPGRVGYRVSPSGGFNDMQDSDPVGTFAALADALSQLDLAYIHVVEAFGPVERDEASAEAIRNVFDGTYIANGGYTGETGSARVGSGKADAIAYGTPFISNPDLPLRLKTDAPLAEADPATFYGGTEVGYSDYPDLTASGAL